MSHRPYWDLSESEREVVECLIADDESRYGAEGLSPEDYETPVLKSLGAELYEVDDNVDTCEHCGKTHERKCCAWFADDLLLKAWRLERDSNPEAAAELVRDLAMKQAEKRGVYGTVSRESYRVLRGGARD